jgi:hypothetical protein
MAGRTSDRSSGNQSSGSASFVIRQVTQGLLIASVAGGLFWVVGLYSSGLRDPRYLDGWVLTGIMAFQLYFHVARKAARLSPRSATRWRKIHILCGYLSIAAFLSHSDMSLPDTGFEWALWIGFVLVTISGILGTYLAWTTKARRWIEEGAGHERIQTRYAELARDVQAVVAETDPAALAIGLPVSPHDGWIRDLYAERLQHFFRSRRNFTAHLIGSQRPLRQLMDEIDSLSRYVDRPGQAKLSAIRDLVVKKDGLDSAAVHFALTRAWLFVHVPVTYSLVVLSVLHILVVYAYSSGAW